MVRFAIYFVIRAIPRYLGSIIIKLPYSGTSTQQYDYVLAEQKKTLT